MHKILLTSMENDSNSIALPILMKIVNQHANKEQTKVCFFFSKLII